MIDWMLSTRQQRMLAALILHPDRSYHTNELIAIGGPGTGAGRRVIAAFEKHGVVSRRRRGNQVIYSANVNNPIFPELRSICIKTYGVAELIANELIPFKQGIELAFLFGSMAAGSPRSDSDVDLMIVGDLELFELGKAVERIQLALQRDLDLNLHTPEEWQRLSQDRVIQRIVEGDKIIIFDRHGSTA